RFVGLPMFHTPRHSLALVALAAALALVGCSDRHGGREEVSGTVKLEGQLIKEGGIDFEPLDGQDTKSGAPITDGDYKVPGKSGLKPGNYRVRITAGDGVTPANPDEPPGPTNIVSKDLVPPEWNVRSDKDVNVTPDGPNRFDFDIR